MRRHILILEDNAGRREAMAACLAKRLPKFEPQFFIEARRFIAALEPWLPETALISLDHDLELLPCGDGTYLDPGTGRDAANHLAQLTPCCPIIIHTSNGCAADGMELVLQEAGWLLQRIAPFGDLDWVSELWLPTVRRLLHPPKRRA